MRIVLLLALVAAVIPAAALAAGSSTQVWVTNCTKAQYKPSGIVLACADVSTYLTSIKWKSWTGSSASGTGSEKQNGCSPSCASGKFHTYAVALALSHPKACHKLKHKVFDDLAVTYRGKRPAGTPKTLKLTLGCPY
jgi:hypothetical protein